MSEWRSVFVLTDAPQVSEQPIVHLLEWRAIEMYGQLYLLGFTWESQKLRMTSPVLALRPDRTAITSSGRLYHLMDEPGDPTQVLIWPELQHNDWSDVTSDLQKFFYPTQ
jgi:hypothetical protein